MTNKDLETRVGNLANEIKDVISDCIKNNAAFLFHNKILNLMVDECSNLEYTSKLIREIYDVKEKDRYGWATLTCEDFNVFDLQFTCSLITKELHGDVAHEDCDNITEIRFRLPNLAKHNDSIDSFVYALKAKGANDNG